jgi:hypothetical protein
MHRNRHSGQQQLLGGLAIAMMPPITSNARTSTSSAAITHFALVSMRGPNDAQSRPSLVVGVGAAVIGRTSAWRSDGVTRRCDVDQAPRGPLARRTHLTGRRARSASSEHTARVRPLWGAASTRFCSVEQVPALDALEPGAARRVRPAITMAVIATGRGESQRDHAIGPATAAKDQRRRIFPRVVVAVCPPPYQAGRLLSAMSDWAGMRGLVGRADCALWVAFQNPRSVMLTPRTFARRRR